MKIRDAFRARHEPEAHAQIARAYWALMISLFALSTVLSIAYGAWEFSRPLEGSGSDVTVGSPRAPLNRADLQEILDGFDERATRFDERRTAPALSDPS